MGWYQRRVHGLDLTSSSLYFFAIGVMLYLGLAGIYLPLTLHSQTKLLYRAPNASRLLSYGPTTLFGTIIQDDLDSFRLTSKHSHTTHCYACHNKVASSTASSNFTRRY